VGWRMIDRWVQKQVWRRSNTGISWYLVNAAYAGLGYFRPTGIAHVLAMLCFTVQMVFINIFMVKYISSTVLLTLVVDVPLLIHLAWFWREQTAHRAAPTQWFCYCCLHAAKVVVLYCRVMPRLPSTVTPQATLRGADFSFDSVYFENLYSPTMLANLLLITPVFYALLMFRTSKAIFGSLSKRVTVDLIMHYDMLWHAVIDMVDQVDMFYYARLAEWVGKEALSTHRNSLVLIQTVVPFLLFFSIVLQAQAFPGVITDNWTIPVAKPSVSRPRTPNANLARSGGGEGLALGLPSGPPLAPRPGLAASSGSVASRRPEFPVGHLAASMPPLPVRQEERLSGSLQPMRSGSVAAASSSSNRSAAVSVRLDKEASRNSVVVQKQVERGRRRRLQEVINLIQRQTVIIARKRSAMVSIFFVDIPFLAVRVFLWWVLKHNYFPGLGIKNGICIALNLAQYTLVAITSQDSYKRIKVLLAEYIARYFSESLPGADRPSPRPSPDLTASGRLPMPSHPGLLFSPHSEADACVPSAASTPQISRELSARERAKAEDRLQKALRRVRRETTRSLGLCAHFWPLFVAFWVGFILARGEAFVSQFIHWVQDPTSKTLF